jgi:hypothetical protein
LEQDLPDRLATEANLNRVVEYEGMEVVLNDGLHLEQDLLDRLTATKANLNRVVEYEGMEVVINDNAQNDAREKEGVAEMEDEWQGDAGEKDGVSETEKGVAENEDANLGW